MIGQSEDAARALLAELPADQWAAITGGVRAKLEEIVAKNQALSMTYSMRRELLALWEAAENVPPGVLPEDEALTRALDALNEKASAMVG